MDIYPRTSKQIPDMPLQQYYQQLSINNVLLSATFKPAPFSLGSTLENVGPFFTAVLLFCTRYDIFNHNYVLNTIFS